MRKKKTRKKSSRICIRRSGVRENNGAGGPENLLENSAWRTREGSSRRLLWADSSKLYSKQTSSRDVLWNIVENCSLEKEVIETRKKRYSY